MNIRINKSKIEKKERVEKYKRGNNRNNQSIHNEIRFDAYKNYSNSIIPSVP